MAERDLYEMQLNMFDVDVCTQIYLSSFVSIAVGICKYMKNE